MRPLILAVVGIASLLGSLTVLANGQTAGAQKRPYKEIKLKVEWTGGYKGKELSARESVILSMPVGERSMTNNSVDNGMTYRKAVFFPEILPDGNVQVEVTVSESTRDQEYPRMTTTVVLKPGETRLIQTRNTQEQTNEYEYQTFLTQVPD